MTNIGRSGSKRTKLNVFADDDLNILKMLISVVDKIESNMGKGEKCLLPAFSPFENFFQKTSSPGQ